MRAREPCVSTISQTLPAPTATPPSLAPGPTSKTAVSFRVFRSTFASFGLGPHSGTHRLSASAASPAHGSAGSGTETTWLVFGSISLTANGPLLPTHTLVGVILTQSVLLAIGIVAVTLSSEMGRAAGGSAGAAAPAPLHRTLATRL